MPRVLILTALIFIIQTIQPGKRCLSKDETSPFDQTVSSMVDEMIGEKSPRRIEIRGIWRIGKATENEPDKFSEWIKPYISSKLTNKEIIVTFPSSARTSEARNLEEKLIRDGVTIESGGILFRHSTEWIIGGRYYKTKDKVVLFLDLIEAATGRVLGCSRKEISDTKLPVEIRQSFYQGPKFSPSGLYDDVWRVVNDSFSSIDACLNAVKDDIEHTAVKIAVMGIRGKSHKKRMTEADRILETEFHYALMKYIKKNNLSSRLWLLNRIYIEAIWRGRLKEKLIQADLLFTAGYEKNQKNELTSVTFNIECFTGGAGICSTITDNNWPNQFLPIMWLNRTVPVIKKATLKIYAHDGDEYNDDFYVRHIEKDSGREIETLGPFKSGEQFSYSSDSEDYLSPWKDKKYLFIPDAQKENEYIYNIFTKIPVRVKILDARGAPYEKDITVIINKEEENTSTGECIFYLNPENVGEESPPFVQLISTSVINFKEVSRSFSDNEWSFIFSEGNSSPTSGPYNGEVFLKLGYPQRNKLPEGSEIIIEIENLYTRKTVIKEPVKLSVSNDKCAIKLPKGDYKLRSYLNTRFHDPGEEKDFNPSFLIFNIPGMAGQMEIILYDIEADVYFSKALALLKLRDFSNALLMLEKGLKIQPDAPLYRALELYCYAEKGKYESSSIESCIKLSSHYDNTVKGLANLSHGMWLMSIGHYKDASDTFEKARESLNYLRDVDPVISKFFLNIVVKADFLTAKIKRLIYLNQKQLGRDRNTLKSSLDDALFAIKRFGCIGSDDSSTYSCKNRTNIMLELEKQKGVLK